MQFCTDHWGKLHKALDDRGLIHLVTKVSKEAFEKMMIEVDDDDHIDYDPLMSCHWMITNKALELGGLYLLAVKEDGSHFCPVCEAVSYGREESNWIDGPADQCLKYCRQQGLVPLPS